MLSKVRSRTNRKAEQEKTMTLDVPLLSATRREQELFRRIQVRAYYLWENAGKPEGEEHKERFWCEAEREISLGRNR